MSLLINIAAQFSGKKALKEAQKQVNVLESSVKKLGATLGVTLSAAAVVAFGKASAKAFIDDEKAATKLSTAVKNLGLSFAQPEINSYIAKLEASAKVADDQLRPAFQALLTTTGSLSKSQQLLTTAIEGSRASGIDLQTVAQDLANAYVGNTRGLKKYNLGLTQAELKAASFTTIQQKLNAQFSGANAAYLTTYAGKMEALQLAASNAQETIGKGLVDALGIIGGKGTKDIEKATTAMDNLASSTANVIRGQAVVISKIGGVGDGTVGKIANAIKIYYKEIFGIQALEDLGKATLPNPRANRSFGGSSLPNLNSSFDAESMKLAKEQAALQKKMLDAQKKNTAELKKQATAKKQNSLFDLEIIQRVAALQGKITEEEKLRLNLQLALLTGNDKLAADLAGKLADSIDKTGKLKEWLATLPDANNPFKGWDTWLTGFIDRAKAGIASIATVTPGTPPAMNGTGLDFGGNKIGSPVGGFTPPPTGTYGSQPTQVNFNLDGKTLLSAILDQSLSGNQSYVNRRTGGFE